RARTGGAEDGECRVLEHPASVGASKELFGSWRRLHKKNLKHVLSERSLKSSANFRLVQFQDVSRRRCTSAVGTPPVSRPCAFCYTLNFNALSRRWRREEPATRESRSSQPSRCNARSPLHSRPRCGRARPPASRRCGPMAP